MILFFISFLMVFVSSYFLVSVITEKKSVLGLIYFPVIAFAQVVLSFEFLSLFSAIRQIPVLAINLFFVVLSVFIWQKKERPIWSLDCKEFINRVLNSFKLDKSLAVVFAGFLVLIFSAIFLCLFMPITNADALSYHVARSLFWISNGNLNHFAVADIRNLCLPINSEILYAWVLMFIKKDFFLSFFSFFGFLLTIISTYNICGLLGFCTRKKLWVIFMLSSFSSVLVQASSTETDIIVAGLVSSSIFLFWYALKNNKLIPIFIASLAYALAIGTKTTSIFTIPAVGLFFLGLSIYYNKKEFYKPLGMFLGFGIINFLIFSSYNYILNYLQFSNFMGSESFMQVSKNYYGIRGIPANLVKYFFMFFDFTGFRWSDYVNPNLLHLRESILSGLHLSDVQDGIYSLKPGVNRSLIEPIMGAGVLGFLVYLPCLAWSLIKPIFSKKPKKTLFLFGFGFLFIINLIVISYVLAYMTYSVRFIMFFMVLSSPILVYSYFKNKNPLKYVLVSFSLFYLICVSTHLWARPFLRAVNLFYKHPSIDFLYNIISCDYSSQQNAKNTGENSQTYDKSKTCTLSGEIYNKYSAKNKILVFLDSGEDIFVLKLLEFKGYNFDFAMLEDIKNKDLSKYNLIISSGRGQKSTFVSDFAKRKGEVKVTKTSVILNKGNTAPCIYVMNPLAPKSIKNLQPYAVHCIMTEPFLKDNNLKMLNYFKVLNVDLSGKKGQYFVIDYNTKNPPIMK